jgi:hypothetical protein
LSLAGALYAISGEKDANGYLWSLDQIQCQTQRVVSPFVAIRPVIDDEKKVS